jgi:hypothetical protein
MNNPTLSQQVAALMKYSPLCYLSFEQRSALDQAVSQAGSLKDLSKLQQYWIEAAGRSRDVTSTTH